VELSVFVVNEMVGGDKVSTIVREVVLVAVPPVHNSNVYALPEVRVLIVKE
jgi:hypothetical protein